ncbi:hypothetical protein CTEN210_13525 [Chaetoceros tenuissimus]|uniref:Leucine-rich repeat domain-containing protein n=1 Tax=Chaetoceros tenuissimus TaxID=426638 RepID=A0AAD3HBH3_9STRA|nr:hypothetical protein CTEN210_13525 [Chaetoceros tenuissimus]
MRVQTEEWRRFIPGVRNYKGKKTYFYNGEKLWDVETKKYLIYDQEERDTWEVLIVLPGVEVIPERTFFCCKNLKTVIMADTVKRIEESVFGGCGSLVFVKLSRNLEYIGIEAFYYCESLPSIFIPSSCREIDDYAFVDCINLVIFSVPQHTQLGECVIADTALIYDSHFETDGHGYYDDNEGDNEEVNEWIQNINQNEEFALHRECASYEPSEDVIYGALKERGLSSFTVENKIGITASRYLDENPFSDIREQNLINRLVLDMMGEIIP